MSPFFRIVADSSAPCAARISLSPSCSAAPRIVLSGPPAGWRTTAPMTRWVSPSTSFLAEKTRLPSAEVVVPVLMPVTSL